MITMCDIYCYDIYCCYDICCCENFQMSILYPDILRVPTFDFGHFTFGNGLVWISGFRSFAKKSDITTLCNSNF